LGLVLAGWLIVILVLMLAAGFLVLTVHPFLAVTQRVDSDALVVRDGCMNNPSVSIILCTCDRATALRQMLVTLGKVTIPGAGTLR